MTLEERVAKLEKQVKNLQMSFLQAQQNQVPITAKVDDSANKIVELTPYTETKVVYYGETEKTFYDVPEGNLTVYGLSSYSVSRISNRLILTFEPSLTNINVTISIS